MPTEHSRSVRTTWLYTLGSIVFFVGFFSSIVALQMIESASVAEQDALLVTAVLLQLVAGAIQVRFCWFLRVGRGGGLPSWGWVAALFASSGAVWVVGVFAAGTAFTAGVALWSATCLVAALLPREWRWPVILLGAAVLASHLALAAAVTGVPVSALVQGGFWLVAVYAALYPFMLITSLWFWEIVVELDRHRRAAAQLAVAQERLRFASDLHDIQGHHLQVISLKAELAERLMARDPDAARDNIREVRLIAKEAMEETRALVAGYRQVSLDDELENAREVLTASGARCTLRIGELPADAAVRAALGSVVREATTNILRHSDASEVTIAVRAARDTWELEVANDGVADDGRTDGSMDAGSGLAGLRERLAALGGTLRTSADGGRFAVCATLPTTAEAVA